MTTKNKITIKKKHKTNFKRIELNLTYYNFLPFLLNTN